MRTRNSNLLDVAPLTILFLVACIAYFIFLVMAAKSYSAGGFSDGGNAMNLGIDVLINYGAAQREGLWDGGWQRLVLPMFMHGGLFHIAFNMYWLYQLGPGLETHFGSSNFGTIYLLSGLGCICLSLIFGGHVSIGASGCVFGMMGANLAVKIAACYDFKRALRNSEVKQCATYIAIYFFLCFFMSNVDHWGHLGGLIFGLFYGWVFEIWRKKERLGVAALVGSILVMVVMVVATRWMVFNPHYHVHMGLVAERDGRIQDADEHYERAEQWAKLWRSRSAAMELESSEAFESFTQNPNRLSRYSTLKANVGPLRRR